MSPRPVGRARFDYYVDRLAQAVGHADRRAPLAAYLTGLLLPGERKSIEPMAAKLDPRHVSRAHQALHHFVANAPWEGREVLAVARDYALPQLERYSPIGAWIVDDTGLPKKGRHSVGVAWQYCGALGKQANCQVAVTVSLTNPTMSVPAAWRLYLPEAWAEDRTRRLAAGIPEDVGFETKWRIALDEIDLLLVEDLPRAPVVAVAGYGDTMEFREALTDRGLSYLLGIKGETSVWPPGTAPLPVRAWAGRGRPQTRMRRDSRHQLKEELGLDHFEGRSWRGFHHHGVLCIAAYCFLAAERGRLSPPHAVAYLKPAPLPPGFVPRGASRATRTPPSRIDYHPAHPSRPEPDPVPPMLPRMRRARR